MLLYDKKWRLFLGRTWLFRHCPFVDFVLAAGSLAMGEVHENSDFDVIVACRSGRIFTARFFCILFFGFFGWRRQPGGRPEDWRNQVCFNHFVTPESYRLSSPPTEQLSYWRQLYFNLVPVYGPAEKINQFFAGNADWLGGLRFYHDDLRHRWPNPSLFKRRIEQMLNRPGDRLERFLRWLQLKKIDYRLRQEPAGYKPRLILNHEELEFHPDTRRIEVKLPKP